MVCLRFGVLTFTDAIKFVRKLIFLQNPFYNNYIVDNNLLAPILDVFLENNAKNNLLDSMVRDLFEYIGTVSNQAFNGSLISVATCKEIAGIFLEGAVHEDAPRHSYQCFRESV